MPLNSGFRKEAAGAMKFWAAMMNLRQRPVRFRDFLAALLFLSSYCAAARMTDGGGL
jgi:hypothetical protein